MGRQIRFYMVEEDEDEFLAYVQSTDDAVIMLSTSTSEEGDILSSYKDLMEIKPSRNYYLWNRSISPKPSLKYVPQQNYYFLNFMDSEVVDVMRSKRSLNTLSMGRLHIETTCFNSEGNVVKKSDVFLSWYDSLCRWIRQNCPEKFDGAYVSSRVSELVASGVELVGHRM